ncbi:O-acetylstemmadenine oxidase-like [Macadamia integrifolia]|uniref:O-acetylstemmadenine oxidase-like n=1 Tax=Macadamia integrifolia TaxID=60698 RepID=UPI001C52849C|nr:O-acetylstemmadenine oxidase-like [Macadamia integrifolia]
MYPFSSGILIILFSVFMSSSISLSTSNSTSEKFLSCVSTQDTSNAISQVLYSPTNSSFSPILQSTIQNLRFLSSKTPNLLFIITPTNESHIQAAVICSRQNGLQIKVRSGGHDYEGLSYRSDVPFIIIDLQNLRSINVDIEERTAWVQAGSTVGEVYYHIANKSNTLGFPAGTCSTIGVGGHFSGGGIGALMRKYGLSADNIIDANIVDVNGRILNRKSMGEDLFWAIRGGGGVSFGIILSWKIKLVPVPPTVTVFTVRRTLQQGATKIVSRWQQSAYMFSEDLFIRAIATVATGATKGESTILVSFQSLFLGSVKELLPLMNNSFPELGLEAKDCTEMSWIKSTQYFAGFTNGESIDVLLNRTLQSKIFYKAKSDFLQVPISETGLEEIWNELLQGNISPVVIIEPLGGRMSEISDTETPFPHRAGSLYNIQYYMYWNEDGEMSNTTEEHLERMRKIYEFMTPYVSKSPRATYLNYRDLDLGGNDGRNTSYTKAWVWGNKYFKNNFKRLASVKSKVDSTNFFWNEQSIPPLNFQTGEN